LKHERISGRTMTPEPLSDTELDRITEILERFGDKNSMNLEQIDGLLAAVVCGPKIIPEQEYLRAIWGDDIINEDTFGAEPLLKDFISLVKRHHDVLAHTLRSGDIVMPLMLEDENGIAHGNDWAIGFMRGMELSRNDWSRLLDDKKRSGSVVPIFTLAHEFNPDPKMRPYKKPISAELREKLITYATAGLVQIFRYFESERLLPTLSMSDSDIFSMGDRDAYVRPTRKIGRNEPCPCGSGKKFKHCCAKLMLH
jgi:uncharacterized protein